MVAKKEPNPANHEKKKKRGKNKRHLLTSMTYHIKEKVVDDEPEELPEDGLGDQISENEELKENTNDCNNGDEKERSKLEEKL